MPFLLLFIKKPNCHVYSKGKLFVGQKTGDSEDRVWAALSCWSWPDTLRRYSLLSTIRATTFRLVFMLAVHRVYGDTVDSPTRPPTATHPYFLQSPRCHALITRCLACHWPRSHTHLFFIGGMLPPASVLWILFSFFLYLFHSAEAGPCW